MTETAANLAAQGTRSGRFRHLFGEPPKENLWYQDLRNPATSGEGRYMAANDKFFAVAKSAGGGPVLIHPYVETGRMNVNAPSLAVHKGKTLDMSFHPFISNMIATASEDCSAAVSQFPSAGLTETIKEPLLVLKGHGKKVALCQFHPTASSILSTASFDRLMKVWDIETQQEVGHYDDCKDNIYSMEWSKDGSRVAMTSKDKLVHLFDPRTEEKAQTTQSFEGAKSSKVFWLPNLDWIGSYGFSKQANRMLKLWDLKKLDKPLLSQKIDTAASILMPFYDEGSALLFSYGKGDGSVTWSEVINDNRMIYQLGQYRSTDPQKGGCFVPKRACDVWKCEIARFLKLTKNAVIPIPLVAPRKVGADVFQADLYPDDYAGKAVLTAAEYKEGKNAAPVTMNMDPEKRGDEQKGDDEQAAFKKKKSYEELEKENEELKKLVAELQKKLGIEPEKEEEVPPKDEEPGDVPEEVPKEEDEPEE